MDDWIKKQAVEAADRAQLRSIELRLAKGEKLPDFDEEFLRTYNLRKRPGAGPLTVEQMNAVTVRVMAGQEALIKIQQEIGEEEAKFSGKVKLLCTATFHWRYDNSDGRGYVEQIVSFTASSPKSILTHLETKTDNLHQLLEYSFSLDVEF